MQKPEMEACPKCRGDRTAVAIGVYGGVLSVVQPDHNPGLLGNKNTSKLHAVTCTSCGYTEFYAHEPDRLLPEIH